jgi:hypothetical protein
LPSTITSIGNYAFYKCNKLESIEIPSMVVSIGKDAFYECGELTSVKIPASVTFIGKNAFIRCEKADIVIDNSEANVTVEEYAFSACKSVTWKK